jgi:nucleoside-triphosphatase THEP1
MTEGEIIMARHIFITGQPGVGKTTLVVAAVRACQDVCGFYTAERRSGSERSGFDVVALSPSASVIGTLATVGTMVAAVAALRYGLAAWPLSVKAGVAHAAAGLAILGCGVLTIAGF